MNRIICQDFSVTLVLKTFEKGEVLEEKEHFEFLLVCY